MRHKENDKESRKREKTEERDRYVSEEYLASLQEGYNRTKILR